ncbi:hypothetical protein FRX31_035215 [Thalictrum thalictroides]|uniref:Uncharacterized protein n=1 Tax=Thalictrum thalictroides TaxID=46969 RepID=A0A7J6URM4_THATH|nr:hypothetical protein FRX31_035215 [Thalictrum thalictroides]
MAYDMRSVLAVRRMINLRHSPGIGQQNHLTRVVLLSLACTSCPLFQAEYRCSGSPNPYPGPAGGANGALVGDAHGSLMVGMSCGLLMRL